MKVLSFDIGVKNLAWCLTGDSVGDCSASWSVLDWGVWDLRFDLAEEPMRPEFCCKKTQSGKDCNREPTHVEISGGTIIGGLCKCHMKHSGASYTSEDIKSLKSMSMSALKTRAAVFEIDTRRKLKREIQSAISERMERWYLHKIPPLKKSKTIPLPLIHKRILERLQDIHIRVDKVVIENQPVRMNAMMKSVQMILWTTLRMKMIEQGIVEPDVTFVNASKKLTVIPNPSAHDDRCYTIMSTQEASRQARGRSYADRKRESILRVEQLLTLSGQTQHLEWFKSNSKRDDLADCLLMCLGGTTV
jgi:hypothetical protein